MAGGAAPTAALRTPVTPGSNSTDRKAVKLGCSKCRYSRSGCKKCRPAPSEALDPPPKISYAGCRGVREPNPPCGFSPLQDQPRATRGGTTGVGLLHAGTSDSRAAGGRNQPLEAEGGPVSGQKRPGGDNSVVPASRRRCSGRQQLEEEGEEAALRQFQIPTRALRSVGRIPPSILGDVAGADADEACRAGRASTGAAGLGAGRPSPRSKAGAGRGEDTCWPSRGRGRGRCCGRGRGRGSRAGRPRAEPPGQSPSAEGRLDAGRSPPAEETPASRLKQGLAEDCRLAGGGFACGSAQGPFSRGHTCGGNGEDRHERVDVDGGGIGTVGLAAEDDLVPDSGSEDEG